MSILVVYFSFDGNTRFIAETISKPLNADILELKTSKQYPTEGIGKFFWGGKSVLFGEKPKLLNERVDLDRYDTIVIGTPVWAGSYTPPVKSFLWQNKIMGKRIAFFASHGGGGADKCIAKLKEALSENEFIGEIDFVDPKKNPKESSKKAAKWASDLLTAF